MEDTFGDQEILPRVGVKYQAEIPEPMMKIMEYDGSHFIREPSDSDLETDFPNCRTVELPIPIMWVHCKDKNNEETIMEADGNDENCTEKVGWKLSKLQPIVDVDRLDGKFILGQKKEPELENGNKGYYPLPGSKTDTNWRDIEYDSFVLGLYIFGKNPYLLKKFVESREMGDILSYYYGKFYMSAEYLRWSQSRPRKIKGKRPLQGKKIFTGWKHNELLSRIFSQMSKECRNMLTEVSRRYGEGKLPLVDYVFTLKDKFGVRVLVDAVAIGKGKQDLTGTVINPSKTHRTILPNRPKIPSGKWCSSLTNDEIIKILTGNFRLSKARSSDIFWEAVWPRLLARGWHSEQPKDHNHADSKNSLVFLVPGVKKFSRRKLMKGDHYFDAISDILNKVALEPGLLEIESDEVKASAGKEESSSDPEVSSKSQPKNLNGNQDSLKHTIEDITNEFRKQTEENNVSKCKENIMESEAIDDPTDGFEFKESVLNTCQNKEVALHTIGMDKGALTEKTQSLLSETNDGPSVIVHPRQSSRNRPMTTRILQAYASEFLIPKKKRKDTTDSTCKNNSSSSSSRNVRGRNVSYNEVEDKEDGDTNMDGEFPK